jgi:type IX secretion system PorP/SprF family membrane protein
LKKIIFLLFLVIGFELSLKAQEPQFSQFYAAPMYLNPAFAGNTRQGRVMANYRNQWPALPKAFVSYSFAYDHNLSDQNSGVGLIIVHDKTGTAGLKYNSVGGLYSYQVQISRKVIIRPGIKVSYVWRGLNTAQLVFPDQLNSNNVSSAGSNVLPQSRYLDVSAGLLLYSKKYWFGYAIDHINTPNQSLIKSAETSLPVKYSFHGGYNIPVKKDVRGVATSTITVAALYKAQQKWDQFDVGFYYTQEPLVLGLWYRGLPLVKSYNSGYSNNDALVALIGFKANDLRIGYSYDLTISRLISRTGGAHELSIVYEYATQKKRKKRKKQNFLVPCAKF